jgi:P27 family predicted phage terminase small subunit
MRGRKPKPIETRRREGNQGKRKLPAPIELPGGLAERNLPPAARQLWDELAPVLQHAGVLASVDAAAFESLCMSWQRACDARAVVEEEGLFSFGSMGQVIEHPALSIERNARAEFLKFAEQFGITPVARARIAAAAAMAQAQKRDEISDVISLDAEEVDDEVAD